MPPYNSLFGIYQDFLKALVERSILPFNPEEIELDDVDDGEGAAAAAAGAANPEEIDLGDEEEEEDAGEGGAGIDPALAAVLGGT